jgi:predicted CXXCH cytochrome family protein
VFAACTDCHRDPHAGAATLAGKVVDCDACHDLRAFAPTTFTVARHAATRYPLEGAHARVRCEACHARRGATVATLVMRPASARCLDCHRDPHGGPPGRDCAPCHTLQAMRPSTVDVAAHARFAFALDGAHRAVPCAGCHRTMSGSFSASRTCAGCHTTPHGTQFAARADRGACDACHDADAWRPAARFDHERDAAFSLAGAHARVPCGSCHRSAGASADRVYRPVSSKCESCHTGKP